ncbi:MAG: methyltransferase [Pseudomonadota bacterium]
MPLFRGIASKRATALFDLCAGFVYSQVLAACTELGLFERLSQGAVASTVLAKELSLSPEAMDRLARAAAALDLLELRSDGRIGLGGQGAALLGNPSVFEMVKHHRLLYADLMDPVALLRAEKGETHLAEFWVYGAKKEGPSSQDGEPEAYSALMEATQAFIAEEALAAHDFKRHKHIVDIGGGTGAFLSAVADAAPKTELTLFDLPEVAAIAKRRFAEQDFAGRASVVGGSFKTDPLPEGADLMTLVRVLHDHDEDVVTSLLAKVRKALAPGGTLLIIEPMAGTRGAEAMGDAYFGMYLWALGTGEPRTEAALRRMLKNAGFRRIRPLKTKRPLLTRILLAQT